jgi:type I restriction enzyme M protein
VRSCARTRRSPASSTWSTSRPSGTANATSIRLLAAAYLKGEMVEGEIAVITREQAAEADYNLSPSRWVGPAADGEEADLKDILDRFNRIIVAEADISRGLGMALTKLRELA